MKTIAIDVLSKKLYPRDNVEEYVPFENPGDATDNDCGRRKKIGLSSGKLLALTMYKLHWTEINRKSLVQI